MRLTNTKFRDMLAYEGSVAYMLNSADVQFTNVNMNYGKARNNGGALYMGGTGNSSLLV